jgi:hypothetical protein
MRELIKPDLDASGVNTWIRRILNRIGPKEGSSEHGNLLWSQINGTNFLHM